MCDPSFPSNAFIQSGQRICSPPNQQLQSNFISHIFFLLVELLGGRHPALARWAGGRYSLRVTGRDKQVFNFTNVCKVPSSTACCLSELFFATLKMPLIYSCLLSNKCAELRRQEGKRLTKCEVSVLGAFCFQSKVTFFFKISFYFGLIQSKMMVFQRFIFQYLKEID